MIRKNKWQLILSSVIILLPIVAGLLLWNYLPEQIATHWGVGGNPDGWGSRIFAIFGMPFLFLAGHWLCIFFTALDPKNKDQSSKVYGMIFWILPMLSLVVCGFVYVVVLGMDININMLMRVPLGIMFVVFGNYMPKCKQNHTIGIRVTWALRNEDNWNKTHRFTGKLWVAGGLLILATLLVPMENMIYLVLLIILFLAIVPVLYSFIYYRQQLKAGTAGKEDAVMTPSEKRMTAVMTAIGIVALAFAAIILFTGKFEITFGETSFTIDAAYWDDVTINYADIDDIEYREQDDPNASVSRMFGYGSFHLLMGGFENEEFGTYTRYSYPACDSCVVLTIDKKTLVINGKDEDQTKAIYNELIKKIRK